MPWVSGAGALWELAKSGARVMRAYTAVFQGKNRSMNLIVGAPWDAPKPLRAERDPPGLDGSPAKRVARPGTLSPSGGIVRARTAVRGNYNHTMARGWESKSVEAQQADAAEKPGPQRVAMTPPEAARERELESLRLSQQNILQQLEHAHDPRHRRMLEDALAELQHQMDSAKRRA